MAKIKFTAKAKDGVVKIPKKHQKNIKEKVTVIAEKKESKKKKAASLKKLFNMLQIETKDLKFNREEANER